MILEESKSVENEKEMEVVVLKVFCSVESLFGARSLSKDSIARLSC